MTNESVSPDPDLSPIERRLATILMADVFGYSRMMGEDEERTVRIFRAHRAVFDELLVAHRGRIFNTAGDAVLAEFPSAVEAVRSATEIQGALRTRNEQLPEAQRMWFRIGINLGDVIVQGGDLLGDGVNVAARIQTIADPGGICISGSVYDQIQNKLTLQIRQLGEKNFKNIAQPVRTFSISDGGAAVASGARWHASRQRPVALLTGIAAALVAVSTAGYWWYRDHDTRAAEEVRVAQRLAEAQRSAEVGKVATEAAAKEAQLRAQLQSAKDALAQAEASKSKAETDRTAAEVAQREAKMHAELKATKEALHKAAESEKKSELDRKASAAALIAAEAAAAKRADKEGQGMAQKGAGNARTSAGQAAAARANAMGIERFDGSYVGRMCTIDSGGSSRCWPVSLTLERGALTAQWASRAGQTSRASGTMGTDGTVNLALHGFTSSGQAIAGAVTGTLVANKLTVTGNWNNGMPVHATWLLRQ